MAQMFAGWLPGAESLPSSARVELKISAGDGGGVGVGVGVGTGVGVGVGPGGLSMMGTGDDAQPAINIVTRNNRIPHTSAFLPLRVSFLASVIANSLDRLLEICK